VSENEGVISSTRKRVSLRNLFLDPNNYRFVDDERYIKIDDDKLLDPIVQKRSKGMIEGDKRSNIKDLISSFKKNGFLDVDIIQAKEIDGKYIVLEGNRRVTALKALQEDHLQHGIDIGKLSEDTFKNIPVEIHNSDSKENHLIVMGLKHISGNKKWSALNQAKLIYDYLEPYWSNGYGVQESHLCDSLGISKVKLRSSQRAYHLILDYKDSDYGDQFSSDMYSLFVEIIKRPSIKSWIGWDDSSYKAENRNNVERLFSWLSTVEDEVDSSEDLVDDDENLYDEGEVEERDPIITKSTDIRDISIFIDNDEALAVMQEYGSIARGLVASGEIDKQDYQKSLQETKSSIEKLHKYKNMIQESDIDELKSIKELFSSVLPKKSNLNMVKGNISTSFEHHKEGGFSSIYIKNFKMFKDFKLKKLNRVNIFAGLNNCGKTTLLEAIYYLTKQNDIVSFLEILKHRNKLKELNPVWLNSIFNDNESIEVSGIFNNTEVSVSFKKFESTTIDKKSDYIASYSLEATIDHDSLANTIHTFGYETLQRENQQVKQLCNSIFKSPYFYSLDEIVETYNKNTTIKHEEKTAINHVISFIKTIDSSINDIRLNESDDIARFIVDSEKFQDKNVEITNYGEGIQRIFEIALAFAYAKNGVICIDEFETAIHFSLLVDFTKFIQELSIKFNVQVFITSHSKECIDAFVNNGYQNEDISAYQLNNIDNKIEKKYISGNRLKTLVDSISLDIREVN
jgi:AAA15 family ATPase/GTPase